MYENEIYFIARLELLKKQMDILEEQKKQLEAAMEHLSYKIEKYEEALKTGNLEWETGRKPPVFVCSGIKQ